MKPFTEVWEGKLTAPKGKDIVGYSMQGHDVKDGREGDSMTQEELPSHGSKEIGCEVDEEG